jgi:GntR family transcriptional regulator/MocR family aminotransferase
MSRNASQAPIALAPRPKGWTLSRWLYESIRDAILSGKLQRGAQVPSTRGLAETYGISRRIVVDVYEQLRDEGYLIGRGGSGTVVSPQIPEDYLASGQSAASRQPPTRSYLSPTHSRPARAFRPIEPAISEFPIATWSRIASRVLRRANVALLAGGDVAGYEPLRKAIASYLGASRGLACKPDQIVIVSGTQQALDLIARLILKPGDPVWLEDPTYPGAIEVFRNAKARLVPVHVDEQGLNPEDGRTSCAHPKLVYLTPAHQFGLGVTLSLPRRLDLLHWARESGAILIEDDYDSEFRFSGRPVPALRGLQGAEEVFHIGTFNKILFPSLRLAYIVAPDRWMDALIDLRYRADRYPATVPQAVLAGFMEEGHFSRHLRRMRTIYGERRETLQHYAERYLRGVLELPEIAAGLSTAAFLRSGMTTAAAVQRAAEHKVELWPLDRFALRRTDLQAFHLGFAAFTPEEIRQGVLSLANALDAPCRSRTDDAGSTAIWHASR